jgi:hypothetical protein
MTRASLIGLKILTILLVILPVAVWAWSLMTVNLACALDESSAACADLNEGLARIGFLKLAVVPWVLAAVCSRLLKNQGSLFKRNL